MPSFKILKSLALLAILLTCLALAAGCAATAGPATADRRAELPDRKESSRNRLIIKFKNRSVDPMQPGFVEGLSRDAGAAISYLHPMSGDAHVFSVDGTGAGFSINTIIRRISGRADVEYVEQDSIMKHR